LVTADHQAARFICWDNVGYHAPAIYDILLASVFLEERMSMFDDNRFCWRETYLVMLDRLKRPVAAEAVRRLQKLDKRFEITMPGDAKSCDCANRLLESLVVVAPNDSAAVEIRYGEGAEVVKEFATLADELERHEPSAKERKKIARARELTAKIELLHFEQIQDAPATKQNVPAKLSFPRYSHFIKNLALDIMSPDDEPDEFGLVERLNPNSLIQILKLVTHLADGIAFDPASGVVL